MFESLQLTRTQAQILAKQALSVAPDETCGVLIGKNQRVTEVIPIKNIADKPEVHFEFDPEQQATIFSKIYRDRLDLIAIYHSHPRSEPIPSDTDIRNATYPDVIHLIIGIKNNEPLLAAWQIRGLFVNRIPLIIDDNFKILPGNKSLSTAQKNAIILSGFIAIIILITYAIYLLPPAPPIPGS